MAWSLTLALSAWALLAAAVQRLRARRRRTGDAGGIDPAWSAGVGAES